MKTIKIKKHDKKMPDLIITDKGDWVDLRVCSIEEITYANRIEDKASFNKIENFEKNGEIFYKKGDIIKIGLGVSMQLPNGYEGIVAPRSSTRKKFGLILTNSIGVIDNSYCGDNDVWQGEFFAINDGKLTKYDRVCQFRIQKNQPKICFEEVEHLDNKDRGGYGTSGIK